MAISDKEWKALVGILKKAVRGEAGADAKSDAGKETKKESGDSKSGGMEDWEVEGLTTKELLKQIAIRSELNAKEAEHNKFLRDKEATRQNIRNIHGDIERLISYVNVIETPHSYDTDIEKNRKDFKRFYTQYDKRRNKSIRIFPEHFLQWYDTL